MTYLLKYGCIFFSLVAFLSCKPKAPNFVLGEDYEYILEKNGTVIRDIEVEQYDGSSFIGKKYIYKIDTLDGSSKVYLFSKNIGYYESGDNVVLRKTSSYKIKVSTLGFKDSLKFAY